MRHFPVLAAFNVVRREGAIPFPSTSGHEHLHSDVAPHTGSGIPGDGTLGGFRSPTLFPQENIMTTTTTTTHTPGPWSIDGSDWPFIIINDPYDRVIALVPDPADQAPDSPIRLSEATAEANARLIAAAPEMADLVFAIAYEAIGENTIRAARALLTRIEGTEP